MRLNTDEKLAELRNLMKAQKLDGWIVPSSDPHLSEYLDPHYQARRFLSGFTGSAGTLVLTDNKAALFTDSRYWVQAQKELSSSEIELIKLVSKEEAAIAQWLKENLSPPAFVGINANLMGLSELHSLEQSLGHESVIKIKPVDFDLIDSLWTDRPKKTQNPIYFHKDSPRSTKEKLDLVREELRKNRADSLFLSKLDSIAWLTNLRGSDLPDNPVFYAFALINRNGPNYLFTQPMSLEADAVEHLMQNNFFVLPYESMGESLKTLPLERVLVDTSTVSVKIYDVLAQRAQIVKKPDPVDLLKAQKSDDEIESIKQAMIKDGVALAKFYCWLENAIKKGYPLDEISIADKLLKLREEQKDFVFPSFSTICAFGKNAALPHYSATLSHFSQIGQNNFLLIDSGAQYKQGTTDITRTTLIGEATEQMKKDYTAVLRGHIRLAKAIFPELISSQAIDAIAREPIWENMAEFGHGTGHGVGFFLNVHEGPQRISYPRPSLEQDAVVKKETLMRTGMVTSDEPGIYRPELYGIRIESLLANRFAGQNDLGRFLRFEVLTLCPIDLKAVNFKLMLTDEIQWLNAYHCMVREILSPHLLEDAQALDWLNKNTQAILI